MVKRMKRGITRCCAALAAGVLLVTTCPAQAATVTRRVARGDAAASIDVTKVVLSNTQERACATAFVPGLRRDLRTRFSVGIYVPYRPSTGDPYVNARLGAGEGRQGARAGAGLEHRSQPGAGVQGLGLLGAAGAMGVLHAPQGDDVRPAQPDTVDPGEGAHGGRGEQPERKRWHWLARHAGPGPVPVAQPWVQPACAGERLSRGNGEEMMRWHIRAERWSLRPRSC